VKLFTIRPMHNPLGPFDFSGGFDDRSDRLQPLEEIMSQGYEVHAFESAGEALDHLRSKPLPTMILLDLMLAGMDGFEFRRVQLSDPRMASVPVALMSGTSDVAAMASVLQAAAFLHKPFDLTALLATVARTCGK